ncbi:MAG: hypothetical protein ACKVT0_11975 [Planctomycetaceae bacterium]
MSRRMKLVYATGVVILLMIVSGFAYFKYRYPYGWSHCCDKQLASALSQYADIHDGWFPRGEATPEASFSLLYRMDPNYLHALRGKTVPEEALRARLNAGELLTPQTCGWHYVEGLRSDDSPELALFWDKVGLGHNGERLPERSHYVTFVNGTVEYIPGTDWDQFLKEQNELRAAVRR